LTEPRLQTAVSSSEVFSVISVHRLLVHDADMLLRRAQVAGILEGDPRMPGLEQHGQHLAPQLHSRKLLEQLHLAGNGLAS
jgi:hypothetical protein